LEPAVTRSPESREPDPVPESSDHHLWRNGRVWWIAFTFHTHEGRKHRVRRSLGTLEREEARARRDELLARYARRPGWHLALRFVTPRADAERGAQGESRTFRARAVSA
jgi:hypothetical protein